MRRRARRLLPSRRFLAAYVRQSGIKKIVMYVGSGTRYFAVAKKAVKNLLDKGPLSQGIQYHAGRLPTLCRQSSGTSAAAAFRSWRAPLSDTLHACAIASIAVGWPAAPPTGRPQWSKSPLRRSLRAVCRRLAAGASLHPSAGAARTLARDAHPPR